MLIDLKQFVGALGDQIAGTDPAPTFSGASVDRSTAAAQNIATSVTAPPVWSTELYDVGGWFAPGSPTLFTVPAGVTRVRTVFTIRFDNPVAADSVMLDLALNGTIVLRLSAARMLLNQNIPLAWNSPSPSFPVSAGDTVECLVTFATLGPGVLTLPANSAETTFAIEAV